MDNVPVVKVEKYLKGLGYEIGSNLSSKSLSVTSNDKSFQELILDILDVVNTLDDIEYKKLFTISAVDNNEIDTKDIAPKKESYRFALEEPFVFVKEDIEKDRETILDLLSDKYGEYPVVSEIMMKEIYEYYDTHFFYGLLQKQVKNHGITFEVSQKATKAAGSARMSNPIRVMLSDKIFSEVTEQNVMTLKVNGLHVINRVDAILRVMEHELTHVVLLTSDEDSHAIESHGNFFKTIVLNLFGHKETTHQLIVSKHLINRQRLTKEQVALGDSISFVLKDGEIISGKVLKKNPKRAKVKVVDGRIYGVYYQSMFADNTLGATSKNTPEPLKQSIQSSLSKDSIRIGDKVKFKNGDKFILGVISKKNPKRAVVDTTDNKQYAVNYEYLHSA